MTIVRTAFAFVGYILSACPLLAAEPLAILPSDITLTGPGASQRLVVEQGGGTVFVGELRENVAWASSDPAVVTVEQGVAVPHANGEATLTATAGERSAMVRVVVREFEQPLEYTFSTHVQSVLTKAGCNSGACHGAIAGKNGFKLSLRGYDLARDHHAITRHARGRRVVLSDPGRSLLLTKPTGAIPHKGGVRFDVDSPDYKVLSHWIATGAAGPSGNEPAIAKLELLPGETSLRPGMQQQLVLRATFDDGHAEDVTRWAKFTATDASVAMVDEAGEVTVMGPGEGAVTAWYLSRIAVARISVPYDQQVPAERFRDAPRSNFIDELVLQKLEQLNLPPSPAASNEEFLRRAYLDTIGVLPTIDETRAFLADTRPDKRERLVDALLERPEFVDYWTYKWSDLLLVNSEKLRPPAMWAYHQWIRQQVAANTPWDEFARRLVTAEGSTLENGAANFFALHQDAPDLAETTSQALLGMAIGCAKCHNHPMEKWTNNQYYAMANLFARVRVKDGGEDGDLLVFVGDTGDLIQPSTGRPQTPAPLDGQVLSLEDAADRRAHLAAWLTSAENPYFARAITNRVWANFFGVGLVEPVDDLRMTNPASNEALLSAASAYLVAEEYDLKQLMRVILLSATYQRSSAPLAENSADRRYYSRYYPRRLMAETLLDAISQVTASPTVFPDYPAGWRAIQLPDSNVQSYFLRSFGRPQRLLTCECERTDEPSMTQVLHLSNGDTLNEKLRAPGNVLEQRLAAGATDEQLIDDAYLAALSRQPTDDEKQKLLAALAATPAEERRTAIEDLYWAILSSREFLFNH